MHGTNVKITDIDNLKLFLYKRGKINWIFCN